MHNLIKRSRGLESLCSAYSLSESILLISNRLLAKWQISVISSNAECLKYPDVRSRGIQTLTGLPTPLPVAHHGQKRKIRLSLLILGNRADYVCGPFHLSLLPVCGKLVMEPGFHLSCALCAGRSSEEQRGQSRMNLKCGT